MKKGRKQIDQSRIDHIVKLRESGLTYREICEELGCGNSTISRYTVEQPTPTPVKVPKRGWEEYSEIAEAMGIAFTDSQGSGRTNSGDIILAPVQEKTNFPKTYKHYGIPPIISDNCHEQTITYLSTPGSWVDTLIKAVAGFNDTGLIEKLYRVLQEHKMNQELNDLTARTVHEEESIRKKYKL